MQKQNYRIHQLLRIPIAMKLAIAITALIVMGMSALGFVILENQKKIMSEQVIALGKTIANQLANSSKEMLLSEDNLGLQTLVNNLIDENKILGASIYRPNKQRVVASGYVVALTNIATKPMDKAPVYFETKNAGAKETSYTLITFISPIIFNDLLAGHAVVTFSKRSMQQAMDDSKRVIISVTALMTFLAIIFAFIMSGRLSKPIHQLVEASKEIGEGNFEYRLTSRRNDEIGDLCIAFNEMSAGLQKKAQVENAFSRYVSSNVAKNVLENLDKIELGGEHVEASVLFADMVGFTSMSESMQPQEITRLLNEYFATISKVAELHNGYIDKFIGDCAMIVFGVPEHDDQHGLQAVSCAVMIQQLIRRLNEIRRIKSKNEVFFSIGINSGAMVAGNLGTQERMEYTVIGDSVNLASRLTAVAKANEIVISEKSYLAAGGSLNIKARRYETLNIRGKKKPVTTYRVEAIMGRSNKEMDNSIDRIIQQSLQQSS